jgi:hypothetical protein
MLLFFKYFPIHTLVFDEMIADDVCSNLGFKAVEDNSSVELWAGGSGFESRLGHTLFLSVLKQDYMLSSHHVYQ